MRAVATSERAEVEAALKEDSDLEAVDRWERSAFLIAVLKGDLEIAGLLRGQGAKINVTGHCDQSALALVTRKDDAETLRWLLSLGMEVDARDQFGGTPLHEAVEYGSVECFRILSDAGADWSARGNVDEPLIKKASEPEIIQLLVKGGEDPSQLEADELREFIGLGTREHLEATPGQFAADRHQRFGTANPERMDAPFWEAMMRTGWNAYQANQQFGTASFGGENPTWCHDRFGMSLTCLPDGRFVQIGGEHEDSYDPDFCIYNEVFVHDGTGGIEIYGYPREVFPPTDFHSATLVGNFIHVIGNLGYREDSQEKGQVFRLDTRTWAMERLETTGSGPGWIYAHRAELVDGHIKISGGKSVIKKGDEKGSLVNNSEQWKLDPESAHWSKL